MDSIDPSAREDNLRGLILEARGGSREALGQLLDVCQGYLLGVANRELDSALAGKLGASDLVQESLVEAQRGIFAFRGESEAELLAWLRQILKNNLADVHRRYLQTEKRAVIRERPIDGDGSGPIGAEPEDWDTPSRLVGQQDEERALLQALTRLSEDYREVIQLRNWQLLSFAEIGRKLQRSEDAARKLWARAIEQLQREMVADHDSEELR